jgi:carboxypeptidase family protein
MKGMSSSSWRSTGVLSGVLVLTFCLFVSVPTYSQATGATLTGTVTDPSGAVVAGATVSARNLATGVVRDVTSDSAGLYTIPNLIAATYEVKASAKGFSTVVQSSVVLGVGAEQLLNFTMAVGATNQTVTVTTEAPQVQLTSSTLSGEVESQTVRELPLNGRDWTQLATLQPGVNKIQTQMDYTTSARGNRGFGNEYTVAGGRTTFNNYRIDGISVVDYGNAAPGNVIGVVLGVDAIQEFSVLTGGFPAEYGRATAGVINAISKQGTNNFHGGVYEFLRNRVLDANDYFTKNTPDPLNPGKFLPRPTFRRNQFGVSAGGPIIKDKTWIFGDYEGLRQAKGVSTNIKVPSDTARLGEVGGPVISTGAGMPCTTAAPALLPGHFPSSTSTVCVSDYVSGIGLPGGTGLIALFPHANASTSDPNIGRFAFAGLQTVPEDFYTARVDHRIGMNDVLFVTYLHDETDYLQPDKDNAILNNSHVTRQTAVIEESHTFTASFLNVARIGYNRDKVINFFNPSAVNPAAALTSLGTITGQTAPRLSIGGGLADFFGGVNSPSHYLHTWNSYQAYDDATWVHGTHSIKFGVGAELMLYNFEAFQNPGGRWKGFGGIQGFLGGNAASYEAGLPQTVVPREFQQWLVGGYIQDDWRFRSNLTLNIGLRYEPTTVLKDGLGKIGSLVNIVQASAPLVDPNLRCQKPFDAAATYGVATQVGTACSATGGYYSNPTLHNFEPRIGFAWDPFKTGKTSVRGQFGFYDVLPLPGYFILQQNQAAPFMVFKSTKNVTGASCPTGGCFAPGAGDTFLVNSTSSRLATSTIETNPHRNYVMQWNLNVQRQLIPDTTLTVGYLGSHGVHLLTRGDDGNMTFPTKTPFGYQFPCGFVMDTDATCTAGTAGGGGAGVGGATSAQLNQPYGVIRYIYWNTDSNYNALNVNLQKRFSHGFQFQVAYTFAKSLDDNSQTIAGDSFGNGLNSPFWFLPKLFKGPSDFNVTHNVTINGLWDIPAPKSLSSGFARQALGGWSVGTILSFNSGVPTTPIINNDPLGLGNTGADQFGLLNKVAGCDPILHGYTGTVSASPNWINASCYTLPTVPTSSLASLPYPCAPFPAAPTAAPIGQTYCANLLGNTGRNSIYGPHLFNWDFSILKNFPVKSISEAFNVQFRAEFFDLTNHVNFVPPQPGSGDGNSALFEDTGKFDGNGVISLYANGQQPGREIQFGLKINW